MEQDHVDVTSNILSLDSLISRVSSPEAGAISTFSGVTRNNFEGKKVLRLEYEAYTPMALKEMRSICATIRVKWDVIKIAMVHRIGVVPVEEASVIIVISSAHRKESLEAVQFAIDEIKARVPVWKKEFYEVKNEDNSISVVESQWKENKECCFSNHQH